MSELVLRSETVADTTNSNVLVLAVAAGAALGVSAKVLGRFPGPLALLGVGVAFWISAGFLIARRTAKGRGVVDGTVWAGTTMAVYLAAWLMAYCTVFGLQQDGGFGAAWLNERIFFILAPAASALFGFIAAMSWRGDWIGDAFLAAPLAWSVPEVVFAFSQGWKFVAVVVLPTLAIAVVPLASAGIRRVNWAIVALAATVGGVVALVLMRAVMGRV